VKDGNGNWVLYFSGVTPYLTFGAGNCQGAPADQIKASTVLNIKSAKEMLGRHPTEPFRRAVWGMTGKTSLARHQMKKLKLFAGTEHPHAAQNPKPLPASVTRKTVLNKKSA
jgi:hypothetical protein